MTVLQMQLIPCTVMLQSGGGNGTCFVIAPRRTLADEVLQHIYTQEHDRRRWDPRGVPNTPCRERD
jgi:hypothetical protein